MKLRELTIQGFKSIDSDTGQSIRFGDVTVLLGANGSGKSTMLSFLHMLQCLAKQEFSQFVAKQGVNRLLFYGAKRTNAIIFTACFDDGADTRYEVKLPAGLPDKLFISYEKIHSPSCPIVIDTGNATALRKKLEEHGMDQKLRERLLKHIRTVTPDLFEYSSVGQAGESGLANDARETSKGIYDFLSHISVYQFHDTSDTAKIKDRIYVDDAKALRRDGGNLAAFLKMLKEHAPYKKYYERIVRHIQRVMPQFGDFELEAIPAAKDYVRLNWKDSSGSEYLFDPHQISDGSLRFMALAALLLQPPDLLPKFIALDEPELGLHPAAIAELGVLVGMAAEHTQVLLATQSTRLVDEFSPEEIVVAERDEQKSCSVFKRLDSRQLEDWLTRYSLSELWEKNVIGGQP